MLRKAMKRPVASTSNAPTLIVIPLYRTCFVPIRVSLRWSCNAANNLNASFLHDRPWGMTGFFLRGGRKPLMHIKDERNSIRVRNSGRAERRDPQGSCAVRPAPSLPDDLSHGLQ